MNNIQLSLSLEEANMILEALGSQPYVRVHQLVNKIQQQAQAQLQQKPIIPGAGMDSPKPEKVNSLTISW